MSGQFNKLKNVNYNTYFKGRRPDKDFTVFMDASKEGLGGVLTQEGHVICYNHVN
jgi:hypothetical protein